MSTSSTLQRAIVDQDNEDAIELLSRVHQVHPDFLTLTIDNNPSLVPHVAPKTQVTSDHIFKVKDNQMLVKYLAGELDDYEALETFMLATESGRRDLASIVLESRDPSFLESVIMMSPHIAGVIRYLKELGLESGILYESLIGNAREVERLIDSYGLDILDYILNLGLMYDHQDVVDIVMSVMSVMYDELDMLYDAINNGNRLAIRHLFTLIDTVPTQIGELLVQNDYDIELEQALVKMEDNLQSVADAAAKAGNTSVLDILFQEGRAKPDEMMMITAVLNQDSDLQRFMQQYIPLEDIAKKFQDALA